MQDFFRVLSVGLLLCSFCTLGCSSQLSEEETPVVASDEEEAVVEKGADNP